MACIDDLLKQFPQVPRELLEDIISKVEEGKALPKSQALKDIRAIAPETLAWMKKRAKDQVVVNSRIRERVTQKIKKGEDPNQIFEELLVGTTSTGKAGKDSVSITRDSLFQRHRNFMETVLGKDIELAADPKTTKSIFISIDKLNKGESVETGVIRDISNGVRNISKYVVNQMEKAGIPIRERGDYIIRQTHDTAKIARAGFEKWKDGIYKELDVQKTFGTTDVTVHDDVLKDIFKDIVSGGHSTQGAGSLGRARKLHFTNGESLFNYHTEFGEGSIVDIMEKTLRAAAKAEAVYRTLGPNGVKTVESLEKFIEKSLKDQGKLDELTKFNNSNFLQNKFNRENWKKQMFGYGDHPGAHWITETLASARQWQALTKLGFAVTSTLTDIAPANVNFMAKTGTKFLSSVNRNFINYAKNWNPSFRKKVSGILQINQNFDTFRFNENDSVRGKFEKFTNFAMKWTLLDLTTKINRSTMATTFSSFTADNAGKGFLALPERFRAEMESFNIKEKDWDQIRKATTTEVENLTLIDPRKIEGRDAQIKYQNFLWHNARFGAIAPGDATKALARMGVSPESVQGQAISTIVQFKTFSLEATRALSEVVKSNPRADNTTFIKAMKNIDNATLLGQLSVLGFGGAMTGLWARDLAKGKTPRDINRESAVEALSRGVYPLWSQYMLDMANGSYNNYGRSISRDLLGPTVSDGEDFLRLMSATFSGSKVQGKAIRFIRRNTPLVNTPFIAPLLNKVFYNQLMESANPGYMNRMIKKDIERGQQPWIPLD